MNDPWDDARAELARQDEELRELTRTLEALGDAGLVVPRAFFDDLDELTAPRLAAQHHFMGLRA